MTASGPRRATTVITLMIILIYQWQQENFAVWKCRLIIIENAIGQKKWALENWRPVDYFAEKYTENPAYLVLSTC